MNVRILNSSILYYATSRLAAAVAQRSLKSVNSGFWRHNSQLFTSEPFVSITTVQAGHAVIQCASRCGKHFMSVGWICSSPRGLSCAQWSVHRGVNEHNEFTVCSTLSPRECCFYFSSLAFWAERASCLPRNSRSSKYGSGWVEQILDVFFFLLLHRDPEQKREEHGADANTLMSR